MEKTYSDIVWGIFNNMRKHGYSIAVASVAAEAGAKAAYAVIATRAGDDVMDFTTDEYPPVVPVCSPIDHAC